MYALEAFKVLARSCRRSSPSTSCSSRVQWSAAKHPWSPCCSRNRTSCCPQSLRCKPFQPAIHSIQRSMRNPLPRRRSRGTPGIMIDGHQNTSRDKTLRSRTWLHDTTGFMAPSISGRFAGTTLALHDMREPNQNQQFGNTSRKPKTTACET